MCAYSGHRCLAVALRDLVAVCHIRYSSQTAYFFKMASAPERPGGIDKEVVTTLIGAYVDTCKAKKTTELSTEDYKDVYDATFITHAPRIIESRTRPEYTVELPAIIENLFPKDYLIKTLGAHLDAVTFAPDSYGSPASCRSWSFNKKFIVQGKKHYRHPDCATREFLLHFFRVFLYKRPTSVAIPLEWGMCAPMRGFKVSSEGATPTLESATDANERLMFKLSAAGKQASNNEIDGILDRASLINWHEHYTNVRASRSEHASRPVSIAETLNWDCSKHHAVTSKSNYCGDVTYIPVNLTVEEHEKVQAARDKKIPRAFHGTSLCHIYSILYHRRLSASGDTLRAEQKLEKDAPSVYTCSSLEHSLKSYACFTSLGMTGVLARIVLEIQPTEKCRTNERKQTLIPDHAHVITGVFFESLTWEQLDAYGNRINYSGLVMISEEYDSEWVPGWEYNPLDVTTIFESIILPSGYTLPSTELKELASSKGQMREAKDDAAATTKKSSSSDAKKYVQTGVAPAIAADHSDLAAIQEQLRLAVVGSSGRTSEMLEAAENKAHRLNKFKAQQEPWNRWSRVALSKIVSILDGGYDSKFTDLIMAQEDKFATLITLMVRHGARRDARRIAGLRFTGSPPPKTPTLRAIGSRHHFIISDSTLSLKSAVKGVTHTQWGRYLASELGSHEYQNTYTKDNASPETIYAAEYAPSFSVLSGAKFLGIATEAVNVLEDVHKQEFNMRKELTRGPREAESVALLIWMGNDFFVKQSSNLLVTEGQLQDTLNTTCRQQLSKFAMHYHRVIIVTGGSAEYFYSGKDISPEEKAHYNVLARKTLEWARSQDVLALDGTLLAPGMPKRDGMHFFKPMNQLLRS